MAKKVIIIEGYLASGKSTFARQLSQYINVPYLMKDTFKIALCKKVSLENRKEKSLFSAVTFDAMMYVVERMFETDNPIIIEGNFAPAGVKEVDEAGTIKQLIDQYEYTPLTFQFSGDTQVLYKRFTERERTVERGAANKIGYDVPWNVFDEWCHKLDNFHVGGEIVSIDTTDFKNVDFGHYLQYAKQFMG